MIRNWILQDLPHALTQRSLETVGSVSFHTNPTKNRKFWSLFEFSRKDNRKDVKKLSKQGDSSKSSKNNKLNDSSKSMLAITNSNKIYASEQAPNNEYTFRYIPRVKSRNKGLRNNINKNDELTSLLDGNLVSTNMKLKLKGYKTLRNDQAKDFAFVPGGKCFELDILPTKNEDGSIGVAYRLSKTVASRKADKLEELSAKDTSYNELESHYIPFPIPASDYVTYTEYKAPVNKTNTDDPIKIVKKEKQQSIEGDTPAEQKDLTGSHGLDKLQVQLESEQKNYEKILESHDSNKQVQQSHSDSKEGFECRSQKTVQSSSPETVSVTLPNLEHSTKLSCDLLNRNQAEPSPLTSLNHSSTQDNVSESVDTSKVGKSSSPYIFPNQISFRKTSHEHSHDSNVKKMDKDNLVEATESEIKSRTKIPKYSMYESKMEQQRRASSPYSTSFVRVRENSTKQRWSGFDRPAAGCCPGSSGSHGTGSQGSTRPYPPTVPTREASSKCYARERDPIVRSDIARSRKMVKTRNSVTVASIATVNFAESSTRMKGERVLLRSKSATGLVKTSQTVAYGSCNKSSSSCNDKNPCSKKRRGNCEDDEMIPGKVICTKPRRRNDCSKPKPCRVEKSCERKFTCTERPPPPRPSCFKPKKKKICKRYCCPSLKQDDCLLKRHTCPPKRGKKCNYNDDDDEDLDRPGSEPFPPRTVAIHDKDPTCLPVEENNAPLREFCTNPKRSRSRNCNRNDRDDDCLETETEPREICTKPKKKECCNSRRSSRRSNSCGNRRYHSESKPLRSSKSFVTIPIFDVSVVSLRPYQNDAVLRFYSCKSGWKPPSSCKKDEDPCKKKCQKPEPKCLNKPKSSSVCGKVKEDNCTRIMKQSMVGKKKDPCGKPKVDPCAKPKVDPCAKPKADPCAKLKVDPCAKPKVDPCAKPKVDPCAKPKADPCAKPKADPCKSAKDSKESNRERLQRELQEMQKCKSAHKTFISEEKKPSGLGRVVSPCKKDQKNTKGKCNKFESIDDLELNVGLRSSSVKHDDSSIGFWNRREWVSSLLNFGMKPDNIIVNRSFCTTRKTGSSYENALQQEDIEELPVLVDPPQTEEDKESFSSEW